MMKKVRMPKLLSKKTLPWVALAVLAIVVMMKMKPAQSPVAAPPANGAKVAPAPSGPVGMDI